MTLRINAIGEYFLLELGAVLRLRMALLFLCWPRQDAIFCAGLTCFGVVDLCTERWMRCRVPLHVHGMVVSLEFNIQVVRNRVETVDRCV